MTAATDDSADPTTCDRCRSSLSRGWSERWVDGKRTQTICFACNNIEQIDSYAKTDIITTALMTRAVIEGVRAEYGRASDLPSEMARLLLAVNTSVDHIEQAVKRLERDVWFDGLQAQVLAASNRGFRADYDGITMLVYSLAGRTVITIEPSDESESISVITADDSQEPMMGIQGIRATEGQAIALLTACRRAWEQMGGSMFQRDDKVGIL